MEETPLHNTTYRGKASVIQKNENAAGTGENSAEAGANERKAGGQTQENTGQAAGAGNAEGGSSGSRKDAW